jgi:hypothetical protein
VEEKVETFKPAFTKALATFVAGATAAPITAAVMDTSLLTAAGFAGLIAVWNLAGRWAQAELAKHRA